MCVNPLLRKFAGIGAVGGVIAAYCDTRTPDSELCVYVLGRVNQSVAQAADVKQVSNNVVRRIRMNPKIVRVCPPG